MTTWTTRPRHAIRSAAARRTMRARVRRGAARAGASHGRARASHARRRERCRCPRNRIHRGDPDPPNRSMGLRLPRSPRWIAPGFSAHDDGDGVSIPSREALSGTDHRSCLPIATHSSPGSSVPDFPETSGCNIAQDIPRRDVSRTRCGHPHTPYCCCARRHYSLERSRFRLDQRTTPRAG